MRNQQGFTLIELMVTISVAAVVMAIAVPSVRDLQANMRANAAANDYVALLKLARSEAITKNRHITVSTITASPPANNNWGGSGWRVTETINGTPETVSEVKGLSNTTTIVSTPASVNSFRFVAGTGLAQNTDASLLNITFRVCDTGSNKERGNDILLNQFGRIFVNRHTSSTLCNP